MCTGTHAFIKAPDTARLIMWYFGPGGYMQNVYHFKRQGGWDAANLRSLCDAMDAIDQLELAPTRSNVVTLNKISAIDLSSDNGVGVELGLDTPRPGTRTAHYLPSNATVAIKWSTGFTGRSYRGRTYHIGLVDDQVSQNDRLSSASVVGLTAAYQAMLDDANTNAWPMQVVSYCQNKAWLTEAVVTPIQSLSVDPVLDSQRRRLPGRGM